MNSRGNAGPPECRENSEKVIDSAKGDADVPPSLVAGWSSLVARQAHNLKVAGSNPAPAPNLKPLNSTGVFIEWIPVGKCSGGDPDKGVAAFLDQRFRL